MAVKFDPILGKLRESDVGLVSAPSISIPDPLIINNLQVTANASINNLHLNNAYVSTATIGNLTTNNISNHSTVSTNYLYANGVSASLASIGFGTFDKVVSATATLGLTHISTIDWNLTSGATVTQEGQMNWDANQQTAVIGMAGGNVDLALGMETLFPRRVRNSTGSTMPKGTVVYINGVSGNTPTVERAIATSDMSSAFTLGMTAESIGNGATGWVTTFGELTGLDLSAYTGGDTLYLSGATAGAFTNVPQSAPIHYVRVGTVVKATTDGALVVNVINGYELNELHNVAITSLASGQILQSGVSQLWYNRSLASAVNELNLLASLGSLAVMNQLSFTSLTNQPSLSSLAFQATIDYNSAQLLNKPSLGSLAPLNAITQEYLPSTASFTSLFVTSTRTNELAVPSTASIRFVRSTNIISSSATITNLSANIGNFTTATVSLTVQASFAGVGTPPGNAPLEVLNRYSTTFFGQAAYIKSTTSSTSGDVIGGYFETEDFVGGVKTIYGHRARGVFNPATASQTLTGLQATSNQAVITGNGSVDYVETLTTNADITNSFVKELRLLRFFTPNLNGTASIGTLIGMDIPDLTTANPNAYAISSNGGKSYHKGNFGFGTITDPQTQIHYSGVMTGDGAVFASTVSTNILNANSALFASQVSIQTLDVNQLDVNSGIFASQVSIRNLNGNNIFFNDGTIQNFNANSVNSGTGIFSSTVTLTGSFNARTGGFVSTVSITGVLNSSNILGTYIGLGGNTNVQALYIDATNTTYGRTAINYPSSASNNSWVGYTFTVNDGTFSGGLYRRIDNADIGIWTQGAGGAPRMVVANNGRVGVANVIPAAQTHIDQNSTTAAIPTLTLEQADLSEDFINFVGGVSTASSGPIWQNATAGTLTHKVRVALNTNTERWLYLYSN